MYSKRRYEYWLILTKLQQTSGENVFFQVLRVYPANHHFNIHLISSSTQSSVQLFLSIALRCREVIVQLNSFLISMLATLPLGRNPNTHWSLLQRLMQYSHLRPEGIRSSFTSLQTILLVFRPFINTVPKCKYKQCWMRW
jgi:hypothetical protein